METMLSNLSLYVTVFLALKVVPAGTLEIDEYGSRPAGMKSSSAGEDSFIPGRTADFETRKNLSVIAFGSCR